jgi:hypothetical protein
MNKVLLEHTTHTLQYVHCYFHCIEPKYYGALYRKCLPISTLEKGKNKHIFKYTNKIITELAIKSTSLKQIGKDMHKLEWK